MTGARWTGIKNRLLGLGCLALGLALMGWQAYEYLYTDSVTIWVIGVIPIPMSLVGALLALGGLVLIVLGGSRWFMEEED